jgi:hypothetical protein
MSSTTQRKAVMLARLTPTYHMCDIRNAVYRLCADTTPLLFKRLMDDGFSIVRSKEDAIHWMTCYDSIKAHINTKWKLSLHRIEVLDLIIWKDMEVSGDMVPIRITTYQKVMSKFLYLPFASHHHRHVFTGIIIGELINM